MSILSIGASLIFGLPLSCIGYTIKNRLRLRNEFPSTYSLLDISAAITYRLIGNIAGTIIVVPVAATNQIVKGTVNAVDILAQEYQWLFELIKNMFDKVYIQRLWDGISYYGSVVGRFFEPPFRFVVRSTASYSPFVFVIGLLLFKSYSHARISFHHKLTYG